MDQLRSVEKITVNGIYYTFAGVTPLPIGSTEVGQLSRTGAYCGRHFVSEYYSVPIYQKNHPTKLSLATSDGFLKFYVTNGN